MLSPSRPAVSDLPHEFLNALPTLILRNLAGAAPCPVPITCCGWPFPQFGVPHKVHSSREQMASMEFQNSVVIPEYDGFFTILTRFPFLISQPISHPNWKLYRLSSIDHERLVCIRMPWSVDATNCSRLSGFAPGKMLIFVMRIIGSRFQPSARNVPPDLVSPMVCAVSRELRYPVNNPSVIIGVHCAATPSSSNPNVPSPGPCSCRASATTFTNSLP